MIYRLNLDLYKNIYEDLVKNNRLIFNFGVENHTNEEEFLNLAKKKKIFSVKDINLIVKNLKNLKYNDYIVIKYAEDYLLGMVYSNLNYIKNSGFELSLKISKIIPSTKLKKSFTKTIFMEVKNEDLRKEILNLEMNNKNLEVLSLNEYKSIGNSILPYEKPKKYKVKEDNNFGELVIELHPPVNNDESIKESTIKNINLPMVLENKEISNNYDKFFMTFLNRQMEFTLKMQELYLDSYFKFGKLFWNKIFDIFEEKDDNII